MPLTYPDVVTDDGGDDGVGVPSPASPRRFGQLPDLKVSDDFDEPLPRSEVAIWEASDAAQADDGAVK